MFLTFATMAVPVFLPEDFISELGSQLNHDELNRFLEALKTNPSLSIRANPFKEIPSEKLQPVPWCSTGSYLKERPSFTLDPLFHAGGYYVQEASSMFLEQAVKHSVDINRPLKVLDLCAAPGGKSTHLLSLINQQSLLVSNEVIRSRANILCENLQKWSCPNVVVTQNDPSHFSALGGFFDLIVVDAPCSGEGLFRKEPESISQWSASNVDHCSQRQRRILADVFPSLKQNGILIYCTCTYNRKENEENLVWLAAQRDVEFITIPLQPDWGIREVTENGIRGYRFFQHLVQGEGFFISAIRKKGREPDARIKHKDPSKTDTKTVAKIKPWILNADEYAYLTNKEEITLQPNHHVQEIEWLTYHLNAVQVGTTVASVKHEKVIPAHSLALSCVLNKENITTINLTKGEALQFLRKETLTLRDLKTGYALVTYSGLGLGWVNGLGNRVNNLYPTHWRIRMK